MKSAWNLTAGVKLRNVRCRGGEIGLTGGPLWAVPLLQCFSTENGINAANTCVRALELHLVLPVSPSASKQTKSNQRKDSAMNSTLGKLVATGALVGVVAIAS